MSIASRSLASAVLALGFPLVGKWALTPLLGRQIAGDLSLGLGLGSFIFLLEEVSQRPLRERISICLFILPLMMVGFGTILSRFEKRSIVFYALLLSFWLIPILLEKLLKRAQPGSAADAASGRPGGKVK